MIQNMKLLDDFLEICGVKYLYQKELVKKCIILKDLDDDRFSFSDVLVAKMIADNIHDCKIEPKFNPYISSTPMVIIDTPRFIKELNTNEYRKFIEENRFKRIEYRNGSLPIPRIQCTKSHGSNIKYDSRRLFNDMGK